MSKNGHSEKLKLGFIGAVEVDGRGFVGGLLVTNSGGRPLEFQCTTPVRPDRTQEILYGKMLRPWLLGELIGGTLLERVKIKPDLVVTSDPDFLDLRDHADIPVVCTAQEETSEGVDLGGHRLKFHDGHEADNQFVSDKLHLIPNQADLEEPLDRVHEALSETVKTVMAR